MILLHARDNIGLPNSWWSNFKNAVWGRYNGDFLSTRDIMLQEYGAKAVVGGLEFESPEQATLFLLKWS